MTATVPNAGTGAPATAGGPAGPVIECDGLVKIFKVADLEVVALQGLDLIVDRGEFVAIVGASGSGKSTLLSILGGMEAPSAGRVVVDGHQVAEMDAAERTAYRRRVLGFIWQQTARNLLPYLNARENIELPMLLEGVSRKRRRARSTELLELIGLTDRAEHRPGMLSGGEQQRVSIAVALANDPEVVFADEPTGELDSATSQQVFDALRTANEQLGVSIVVVTHDHEVTDQVQRTVEIRDGRTSTEVLRRGDGGAQAEQFAVLDRAGRVQLPREYVDALRMKDRVRLAKNPDHIGVWPDRTRGSVGSVEQEA